MLFTGRSSFYLSALEATFIETFQPDLVDKKNSFVTVFKIFH